MNLEKVQRHGMHEHCYLNCLLKSSSSDNPRLKSCNLLLIWFIRVKTQIIKTAVFTPSPASRTEAKALDGYFMSEVLAWKQWGQHGVGGPHTTAVLKQRAYISGKAHWIYTLEKITSNRNEDEDEDVSARVFWARGRRDSWHSKEKIRKVASKPSCYHLHSVF